MLRLKFEDICWWLGCQMFSIRICLEGMLGLSWEKCLEHCKSLPSLTLTTVCVCVSAPSGSDSPDQALEAEEIVKQLDIEHGEETPTSTATSTQELYATTNYYSSVTQLPPLQHPHIPEASPTAEEVEVDAVSDLPPLTGRCHWHTLVSIKSCFRVFFYDMLLLCFLFKAPGSSPDMTYVDSPPPTVPPEASYEEDWEVFDPWVNCELLRCLDLSISLYRSKQL